MVSVQKRGLFEDKKWIIKYNEIGDIEFNTDVKVPKWLNEVLDKGFTKTGERSQGTKVYIKKNNLQEIIKIFSVKGLGRYYKPTGIFGSENSPSGWLYLKTNPTKLIVYLEIIFFQANKDARNNKNKRKAFTHIIHANGLHWSGCYHNKAKVKQSSKIERPKRKWAEPKAPYDFLSWEKLVRNNTEKD